MLKIFADKLHLLETINSLTDSRNQSRKKLIRNDKGNGWKLLERAPIVNQKQKEHKGFFRRIFTRQFRLRTSTMSL